MNKKPIYPIFVPSKNRAKTCFTANCFIENGVDFKLVVEPSQVESYGQIYDKSLLLIMPKDDMKLLGTRLWIRDYSIKKGFKRHWQFDDNIRRFRYLKDNKRIPINPNTAISIVEEFTDRYENIGISGFNYTMFVVPKKKLKPFYLNCHVYSACLINNGMPYKWRLIYNDDTDLCLQVLTNGLCTVAFNVFNVEKMATMTVKGGNTDDLYKGDGRLRMARSLEFMWPEYVKTIYNFGRPQHSVNWKKYFKHGLIRRKDIDWDKLKNIGEYRLKLNKVGDIKSKELKKFYEDNI